MSDKEIIRVLRAIVDALSYISIDESGFSRDNLNEVRGRANALLEALEEDYK